MKMVSDFVSGENSIAFIGNGKGQFAGGYSLDLPDNFGDFDQTFDIEGTPAEVALKADGFTFGGVGSLPLGDRFALFARAGVCQAPWRQRFALFLRELSRRQLLPAR